MQGRESKKIIPILTLGTIFINLDFNFCDFIKHPNISNNKDIIKRITNNMRTDIKVIKNILYIIFSKSYVYISSIKSLLYELSIKYLFIIDFL